MLVDDVEIIVKFCQPVGIKYLTDQLIFRTYFPLKEIFFK